jgi:hypothetical protein
MSDRTDNLKLLRKFCKHVNRADVIEVDGNKLSYWKLGEDKGDADELLFHAEWKGDGDESGLEWHIDIPAKSLHPDYAPKFDSKTGKFTVADANGEATVVQMFKVTPIRFGGC